MRRTIYYAVFIFFITYTFPYAQLKFDAELRPRAEVRHGYKNLPDSASIPAFFVSQRSRFGLTFTHDKYEMRLAIQDVRVWGDEKLYSSTGVYGDYSSIDLKEAWIKFFVTKYFSIKAGRQELKYGDQRLIARRNWNQNGLSYDALVFGYKKHFTLDAGLSYNNDNENTFDMIYDTNKIKTFNFLYFSNEFTDQLKTSATYIASGYQKPFTKGIIYLKNTLGGDITLTLHNTSVFGSCYYQFGKNSKGNDVKAYMFSTYVQQKINPLTLIGGTDYLSGHDNTNENSHYVDTDHRFDLLQGARHGYYGHLDYFSNLNKGTGGGGLIDAYIKSQYSLSEKISIHADYHYFMLQNKF